MAALRIAEGYKNFNVLLSIEQRTKRNFFHKIWIQPSCKSSSAISVFLSLAACIFITASPVLSVEPEIDGLVIDQTLTRIGAELYRNFMLYWTPPSEEGIKGYSLTIVERASAQWGFWVWVLVNDTIVFQKVMKPQADDVEYDARAAVAMARKFLIEQSRGENIKLSDLKGDGI